MRTRVEEEDEDMQVVYTESNATDRGQQIWKWKTPEELAAR